MIIRILIHSGILDSIKINLFQLISFLDLLSYFGCVTSVKSGIITCHVVRLEQKLNLLGFPIHFPCRRVMISGELC